MRRLRAIDYEKRFRETPNPIILTNFDVGSIGYSQMINECLYGITYDREESRRGAAKVKRREFSYIPACRCRKYEGQSYVGLKCHACDSVVKDPLEMNNGDIPNDVWLEVPRSIKGVLNPDVYMTLAKWLSVKVGNQASSYIDVALNPKLPLPPGAVNIITGRGFNWFYDNYDEFIERCLTYVRKGKNALDIQYKNDMIREYVKQMRPVTFTRFIPCLSNVLHAVATADANETDGRAYTDKGSEYILEAAHTLSYLNFTPDSKRKLRTFDEKLYGAFKKIVTYCQQYIVNDSLADKYGHIRQHCAGTRFHWSFRSVIVPNIGHHDLNDIILPWSLAVNLLKIHIIGALWNRYGIPIPEACRRQYIALQTYDPLIDTIMTDLIKESELGGLPIIFNRNPSVRRGASQNLKVPYIKKHPKDKTIAMSPLICKAPNADFDGDAMNGWLILEREALHKGFRHLEPAQRHRSTDAPILDTSITLPSQAFVICNAFLDHFDMGDNLDAA